MWTPSQFPLTMALCKDLRTGEFLPRLGYGRTRVVSSLPDSEDCVLKLCMVRQHHGKEFEWGLHCNLVAATFLKGQVSVDFGEQARFVHFSVQRRAVARWGSNPPLVRDMAHYLLATLLSLELRGVVLCDVGPSNAMVRANVPYAQAIYGDVAGWSIHKKLRHMGVGGFVNIFQLFPAVQSELERILVVAKPAFKLAANSCGRFGAFLANEGLAVLEASSQTLEAADLLPCPQELISPFWVSR